MRIDMAIDLGTSHTTVYIKGRSSIIREPSIAAINYDTKKIISVGYSAKNIMGRAPKNIVVAKPIKNGAIADFGMTCNILKYFIKKANPGRFSFSPRVLITMPDGITTAEKKALIEAALLAGAREVELIESIIVSAIGASLPITEPVGNMIINIGGGISEAAIISLGGIVIRNSLKIAGDELTGVIIRHIRKTHNLLIGENSAEKVKLALGSVYLCRKEEHIEVKGTDIATGLPRKMNIPSLELVESLSESLNAIVNLIKFILERVSPDIASDIVTKGIILTGGGALLHGLDKLIEKETGVPAFVAQKPLDCVVQGFRSLLGDIEPPFHTKYNVKENLYSYM